MNRLKFILTVTTLSLFACNNAEKNEDSLAKETPPIETTAPPSSTNLSVKEKFISELNENVKNGEHGGFKTTNCKFSYSADTLVFNFNEDYNDSKMPKLNSSSSIEQRVAFNSLDSVFREDHDEDGVRLLLFKTKKGAIKSTVIESTDTKKKGEIEMKEGIGCYFKFDDNQVILNSLKEDLEAIKNGK